MKKNIFLSIFLLSIFGMLLHTQPVLGMFPRDNRFDDNPFEYDSYDPRDILETLESFDPDSFLPSYLDDDNDYPGSEDFLSRTSSYHDTLFSNIFEKDHHCPDCNFTCKNEDDFITHMTNANHGPFRQQNEPSSSDGSSISIILHPTHIIPQPGLASALHAIFSAICLKQNSANFLEDEDTFEWFMAKWQPTIESKKLPTIHLDAKRIATLIKSLPYCFALKNKNNTPQNLSVIGDLSRFRAISPKNNTQIILLHIGEGRWITIKLQLNNDTAPIEVVHPFYQEGDQQDLVETLTRLYHSFKNPQQSSLQPQPPVQQPQQPKPQNIFPPQLFRQKISETFEVRWKPIPKIIKVFDKKKTVIKEYTPPIGGPLRVIKKQLSAKLYVTPCLTRTNEPHIGAFHALFNALEKAKLDQKKFNLLIPSWRQFLRQYPIHPSALADSHLYKIIQELKIFEPLVKNNNISILNNVGALENAIMSSAQDEYGILDTHEHLLQQDIERLKKNDHPLSLTFLERKTTWDSLPQVILNNIQSFRQNNPQVIILKVSTNNWVTITLTPQQKQPDKIEVSIPFFASKDLFQKILLAAKNIYFLFKKP